MSIPQPATQVANEIFVNITGKSGVTFTFERRTVFIDFATEAPSENSRFPFEDTGVRVDHQQPANREGKLIYPFQAVRGVFSGPNGPARVVRVSFNPKTRTVELIWPNKSDTGSKASAHKPTAPTKVEPKAALSGGPAVPVAEEESEAEYSERKRKERVARFKERQRLASGERSDQPKASGSSGSRPGSTNWRNELREKAKLPPLSPAQLLAIQALRGDLVVTV